MAHEVDFRAPEKGGFERRGSGLAFSEAPLKALFVILQVSAGAGSPYDVKDLPFRYTLHVFEHLY